MISRKEGHCEEEIDASEGHPGQVPGLFLSATEGSQVMPSH
jgi:hypothetical protein